MSHSAMDMLKSLPEDEARRFCLYAGWHYNGDTHAMLGNGGIIDLPEVMVAFYRHLIEENKRLREMLEEHLKYHINPLTIVTGGPK
jgi:hypothetical protein